MEPDVKAAYEAVGKRPAPFWHGPVIDCQERHRDWFQLPASRREELCAWIDRQVGQRMHRIIRTEYAVVDHPMIRVTRILTDPPNTRNAPAVLASDGQIATVTTEHMVREPLPSWWHQER